MMDGYDLRRTDVPGMHGQDVRCDTTYRNRIVTLVRTDSALLRELCMCVLVCVVLCFSIHRKRM